MLPAPTGDEADRAVIAALKEHGVAQLPWSKESGALRHRLQWLHRALGAAMAGYVGCGSR